MVKFHVKLGSGYFIAGSAGFLDRGLELKAKEEDAGGHEYGKDCARELCESDDILIKNVGVFELLTVGRLFAQMKSVKVQECGNDDKETEEDRSHSCVLREVSTDFDRVAVGGAGCRHRCVAVSLPDDGSAVTTANGAVGNLHATVGAGLHTSHQSRAEVAVSHRGGGARILAQRVEWLVCLTCPGADLNRDRHDGEIRGHDVCCRSTEGVEGEMKSV